MNCLRIFKILSAMCIMGVFFAINGCGGGISEITPNQSAASPTFSPSAGTYSTDQAVTIQSVTTGAAIHYTTDGSTPTSTSPVYGTSIPVAGNGTVLTIKAIAMSSGMTDSAVVSATFTINYPQTVATPTFSPPAGT